MEPEQSGSPETEKKRLCLCGGRQLVMNGITGLTIIDFKTSQITCSVINHLSDMQEGRGVHSQVLVQETYDEDEMCKSS